MSNTVKLKIEVGAVPSVLELKNCDVLQDITTLLEPFATTKEPAYRIKVDMGNGLRGLKKSQGVSSSYYDNIFKVETEEFEGLLNCRENKGQIRISSRWPSEAFMCALVDIYCFVIIVKEKGVILHASGVVRENKAYIFTGPSGSGKSTVADASSNYTVLSEELIGIIPERGSLKAFPVPYASDIKHPSRVNHSFPIVGLFKLVKDRKNFLREIPKPRALVDFFTLPSSLRRFITLPDYLNRFGRLIKEIPCYELHFLPDSSFWRCINERVN